jgi:TM2 domain-containing membrane protein YozV
MSCRSILAVASPFLVLACVLLAPQHAEASVTTRAALHLIDRGDAVASTSLPLGDAHLLDARLDSHMGSGGDSGHGGGLLPALLTLVIPGLGQLWNGQVLKGIIVFVVVAALYGGGAFVFGGLGALLGLVVHLFAIADAYEGGGIIPGGGGDVAPALRQERREAEGVSTRFDAARPGLAVAAMPTGAGIAW